MSGDDAPVSPSVADPGRRGQPPRYHAALPGRAFSDVMGPRPLGGRLRAVRRLLCLLLWMLCCMPVQAVLLALPGQGKIRFARFFWRNACRLFGLEVRVLGVAWVVDGWANCCGFVADGVLLVDGGLNADA